jgi:DNA-binding NtrC family response regulator
MPLRNLEGLRILIAEDEALILMELEDMLLEMECTIVGTAATVEETLKAIRENEIDGALLDMSLHGKRITPAADALVARGVPFVLCTGYAREDGDETAIRNAPRLTKPFNMQSLRAAMDDAFGRDRA